jgi:hypothetical protein
MGRQRDRQSHGYYSRSGERVRLIEEVSELAKKLREEIAGLRCEVQLLRNAMRGRDAA